MNSDKLLKKKAFKRLINDYESEISMSIFGVILLVAIIISFVPTSMILAGFFGFVTFFIACFQVYLFIVAFNEYYEDMKEES